MSADLSDRMGRKRKHSESDADVTDRPISGSHDCGKQSDFSTSGGDGLPSSSSSASSVEALLSVPLDFIFRESPRAPGTTRPTDGGGSAGAGRRRHLLSRSEASVLLRVSQLASELDVLLEVAASALDRARQCRHLRRWIEDGGWQGGARLPYGRVVYLRSLLPLLAVHGERVPSMALTYVTAQVGRVLSELAVCGSSCRQFAEQNWTVADSLFDAFGGLGLSGDTGHGVAREKRVVAEVLEAVCVRIEGLTGMAGGVAGNAGTGIGAVGEEEQATDAFELATDPETRRFVSMRDFCTRLLREIASNYFEGNGKEDQGRKSLASSPTQPDLKAGGESVLTELIPDSARAGNNDDVPGTSAGSLSQTTESINNAATTLHVLASSKTSGSQVDLF